MFGIGSGDEEVVNIKTDDGKLKGVNVERWFDGRSDETESLA